MAAPIDLEHLHSLLATPPELRSFCGWRSAAILAFITEAPALLSVYTAACALVDREGPLVEADRTRDPLCVAVDAARGMTAREAIEERIKRADGATGNR